MFARGELVLDRNEARMPPVASIVIQDGYSYVFVLKDDNTVERRRVETGTVKDNLIEIVSGVEAQLNDRRQGRGIPEGRRSRQCCQRRRR